MSYCVEAMNWGVSCVVERRSVLTPGWSLRRAMVERYLLSEAYESTAYFLLSGSYLAYSAPKVHESGVSKDLGDI